MKKGLKLWMLAVALVATATAVISTWKVNADQDSSNQVQVVIGKYNDGNNTCSWGNFLFNFTASTEDQTDSTWNVFECKFGNSAQKTVTLQLQWDLTSTSGDVTSVISWSNVKVSNTVRTKTPDSLWSNTAINNSWATALQTLFDKAEKTIWDASWTVNIEVTVPGWKPDGTYNGTLVLTF